MFGCRPLVSRLASLAYDGSTPFNDSIQNTDTLFFLFFSLSYTVVASTMLHPFFHVSLSCFMFRVPRSAFPRANYCSSTMPCRFLPADSRSSVAPAKVASATTNASSSIFSPFCDWSSHPSIRRSVHPSVHRSVRRVRRSVGCRENKSVRSVEESKHER